MRKPYVRHLTAPARGSVTVPFTLGVPERAESGDHPGGLVALDERIDTGDGSLAVGVRRAVGARVYLRVNGPTVPALAVERVGVRHRRPPCPAWATARRRSRTPSTTPATSL